MLLHDTFPANNDMLKPNNRSTTKNFEILLKLIKTVKDTVNNFIL